MERVPESTAIPRGSQIFNGDADDLELCGENADLDATVRDGETFKDRCDGEEYAQEFLVANRIVQTSRLLDSRAGTGSRISG